MDDISTFTHAYDGERLSGAVAGPAGRATALLLHGAGNGSKERSLPFLADFAGQGCRALALDFSGHGESTGELAELSLRRRYEQAVSVLDAHAPANDPLILVGFSMSGQTVADLMRHYGRRVAAVGLCAPAVYGQEAWDVPFGNGDSRFSELIRRPDSWRDSPALEVFRSYAGRAVLAVPGHDTIIPAAVTEAIQEALSERSRFSRFDLPDAEHILGLWFRDHDGDRREFVTRLLAGLDGHAEASLR
ncbi:alpha/beta hydrolase [Streptomyces lavenduligriseus]|uniref:Lysophospholipase n=1 Tax=Streptomyces lavenduligriseus TaxID=67315 RepID=A0ABT0NR19_9ACTN|nr:alpha/beta fold hydrolase [Streptomyces lavenduligriseus]MCL3993743.1 lysophospholipase [Streptomyces lavenduligriseus]